MAVHTLILMLIKSEALQMVYFFYDICEGLGGQFRNILNQSLFNQNTTTWKKVWMWQDSNLQSPDPKSSALSIRPHTLQLFARIMQFSKFCS